MAHRILRAKNTQHIDVKIALKKKMVPLLIFFKFKSRNFFFETSNFLRRRVPDMYNRIFAERQCLIQ